MACRLSTTALRSLCNPKQLSRSLSLSSFIFSSSFSSVQGSSLSAGNPFSGLPFIEQKPFLARSTPSSLLSQNLSLIAESSHAVPFVCGRGDKKTKKGKRFRGKFGNSRPNREHRIRRIRERWEQAPGTPWPVPGLSVEDYRPVF